MRTFAAQPAQSPIAPPASRLDAVEMAPADPILGVTEAFKRDTHPDKLNLGVGAYRTEELKPLVLKVVRKAEEAMLAKNLDKEYLPVEGLAAFRKATIELLLGADSPAAAEGRVACLQALSGTGGVRMGAAFIERFLPKGTTVYISNPTWSNHLNIFRDAGVPFKQYRRACGTGDGARRWYFDPETVGLDFEGMMEDLKAAPDGSVVLLHGCAHNPTGVDPTREQWRAIGELCAAKDHLPFFDVAYQASLPLRSPGFASGSLEDDAFAPRLFESMGLEFAVAQASAGGHACCSDEPRSAQRAPSRPLPAPAAKQITNFGSASYSKNLGLYAERIGAISFVLDDPGAADRALSQLKRLARPMWSNPPVHGARIVAEVVGSEATFEEWKREMAEMAGRIKGVRQDLYDHLTRINPDKDWSFVLRQLGMFSFTGLSPAQVENMTSKWHIYMTRDGRISLAGLNKARAEYLARAIDDSPATRNSLPALQATQLGTPARSSSRARHVPAFQAARPTPRTAQKRGIGRQPAPPPSAMAGAAGASGDQLLIVGPGVLGSYLGNLWMDEHGRGTVVGQTNSETNHSKLQQLGFKTRTAAQAAEERSAAERAAAAAAAAAADSEGGAAPAPAASVVQRFPYVAYCAPPSGSADYAADVQAALQLWDGTGSFVFTSSAAVYTLDDGTGCDESTPVFKLGENERVDKIIAAEQAVLTAGGNVVRLVGLYHAQRGAHTFFLRQGEVARWGGYILNLIHYEDAASLCAAGRRLQPYLAVSQRRSPCHGMPPRCPHVGRSVLLSHPQAMMDVCLASPVFATSPDGTPAHVAFTGTEGPSKGKRMHNGATRVALAWYPKYPSFGAFVTEGGAVDWYAQLGGAAPAGLPHAG
eukprot:scaffold1.g5444.t1